MFLLDTDHFTIIQQQTEPQCSRLAQRMNQFTPLVFYVSVVSFHEQVLGWNAYLNRARGTAGTVRAYHMFERILADFAAAQVLPFDQRSAHGFDSLRAGKVRIGTFDLRIAAIALSRGFTILSRNIVDFRKVPSLKAEDWTLMPSVR